MQPLYATLLSYPKQYATAYATALGNRLWKWYVTACLVTYPVMQPLMETVLVLPKSLEPLHLFSRKARTATASLLITVSINGYYLYLTISINGATY